MGTVADIEQAVAKLRPDELAAFRKWFEAFEAESFDRRIAADASAGKLEGLAEEALSERRRGEARQF